VTPPKNWHLGGISDKTGLFPHQMAQFRAFGYKAIKEEIIPKLLVEDATKKVLEKVGQAQRCLHDRKMIAAAQAEALIERRNGPWC
jgi:hypothetical protein